MVSNMTDAVKSCPFCGSDPLQRNPGFVSCPNANCPIGMQSIRCDLWNSRANAARWKPIETAPDDLTVIVASISINGQVNWVSDGIRGKGVMRLLWHTLNGTHVPSPTHWIGLPNDWMPLPVAPENDDE